jgi:peptide/nickel transport system substrate-binding protein
MKSRAFAIMVCGLVVGLILVLTSVGGAQKPRYGGTLTVVHGVDISHLDFHIAPGYESMWINENIHNGLVTLDKDLNVAPDVAKSWESSHEATIYTFYLHEGVKFHDGTDVDAEAVKWNFDRVLDPKTKSGLRGLYADIERVEAVDKHSVRFVLQEPNYLFPLILAGYRAGFLIISPTAFKTIGEKEYRDKPVGSGPFKFLERVPNDHVTLVRNENYFKEGLPYLDKVTFKVLTDSMTQVSAIRAAEVDLLNSVSHELVRILEKDRNIVVLTGPETTPMVGMINVSLPPFDDLRVRKAIGCYGTDRVEIVQKALLGLATPVVGMAPPGVKDYVDLRHLCPYDPEKARALLKTAGYDERNPLRFTLITNNEKQVFSNIGVLLKDQYKKLGVEVKVEVMDKVAFLTYMVGKNRCTWNQAVEDFLSLLTAHNNNYLIETTSSWNISCHSDKKVDESLRQIKLAPTEAEQREVSAALQTHVAENLYWTVLSGSPHFKALRRHVKGFDYQGEFKFHVEKVWLEK